MSLQFRKAERKKAKLRLALTAPSGYGKTYSALRIATGLGGKIALLDTENGSGDLYADDFEYDILTMNPPYDPAKYVMAIKAAEEAGYDTIILDSLSHAWAGTGGLLDKHGAIADKGGNSFAAWRKVTPQHTALVDAILQAQIHVIGTMRSKVDYSMEGGKVTKLGMAPVQREGMEYEFTCVFDLDKKHRAEASKDRTGLFDNAGLFPITEEVGEKLLEWLNGSEEANKEANE